MEKEVTLNRNLMLSVIEELQAINDDICPYSEEPILSDDVCDYCKKGELCKRLHKVVVILRYTL